MIELAMVLSEGEGAVLGALLLLVAVLTGYVLFRRDPYGETDVKFVRLEQHRRFGSTMIVTIDGIEAKLRYVHGSDDKQCGWRYYPGGFLASQEVQDACFAFELSEQWLRDEEAWAEREKEDQLDIPF